MTSDPQRTLGLNLDGTSVTGQREQVVRYINLKLEALGLRPPTRDGDREGAFLDGGIL